MSISLKSETFHHSELVGKKYASSKPAEDRIAKTAALLLLYKFRNLRRWASY
jgi:hypothetical protein